MVSYRRLAMRVLGHVPVPFGKQKSISPSPRCRTTDRSSRSRLCHDDRHDPSCFCRYV